MKQVLSPSKRQCLLTFNTFGPLPSLLDRARPPQPSNDQSIMLCDCIGVDTDLRRQRLQVNLLTEIARNKPIA